MIVEKSNGSFEIHYVKPNLVIEPGTFRGTEQELAQAIQRQVETYPETFDMGAFIDGSSGEDNVWSDHPEFEERKAELEKKDPNVCGTTLCIAGYAQLFADGEITKDVLRRGEALLGLNEGTQLFFTSNAAGKVLLDHLAKGTYEEDLVWSVSREMDNYDPHAEY